MVWLVIQLNMGISNTTVVLVEFSCLILGRWISPLRFALPGNGRWREVWVGHCQLESYCVIISCFQAGNGQHQAVMRLRATLLGARRLDSPYRQVCPTMSLWRRNWKATTLVKSCSLHWQSAGSSCRMVHNEVPWSRCLCFPGWCSVSCFLGSCCPRLGLPAPGMRPWSSERCPSCADLQPGHDTMGLKCVLFFPWCQISLQFFHDCFLNVLCCCFFLSSLLCFCHRHEYYDRTAQQQQTPRRSVSHGWTKPWLSAWDRMLTNKDIANILETMYTQYGHDASLGLSKSSCWFRRHAHTMDAKEIELRSVFSVKRLNRPKDRGFNVWFPGLGHQSLGYHFQVLDQDAYHFQVLDIQDLAIISRSWISKTWSIPEARFKDDIMGINLFVCFQVFVTYLWMFWRRCYVSRFCLQTTVVGACLSKSLDDDALSTVICKRQHGLAGIDFQHWTRFSPQASDEKPEDSTRSIVLLYQTSWMDIISSICVEGEQPWLCTFGTHVSNVNNHGCSPLRQILLASACTAGDRQAGWIGGDAVISTVSPRQCPASAYGAVSANCFCQLLSTAHVEWHFGARDSGSEVSAQLSWILPSKWGSEPIWGFSPYHVKLSYVVP